MKLKFLLEISAELTNVKKLSPKDGVDSVTMPYFFKLRCENCNEKTDEQCTYLDQKMHHNNKEYNHVIKCKGCDRIGTVKLIPGSGRKFTAADSGTYVPLMVFECDGLIAHKYIFNGGWVVELESSKDTIEINLVSRNFVGDAPANGDSPPKVENAKGRFVMAD